MTDKEYNLLPCPFCGRQPKLTSDPVFRKEVWSWIKCGCEMRLHVGSCCPLGYWPNEFPFDFVNVMSDVQAIEKSTASVIKKWNTRN